MAVQQSLNLEVSSNSLEGQIFRIKWAKQDKSYYIFLLQRKDDNSMCTVKGASFELEVGDNVICSGEWVNDQKWGEQFNAKYIEKLIPESKEGIQKFLSSGLFKGIGDIMAKKIVKRFGNRALEILEEKPELYLEISGITEKKLNEIKEGYKETKKAHNAIRFLLCIGVTANAAMKIYSKYQSKTVDKVKENPYCLISDVEGYGFIKADDIALNMGIPRSCSFRILAGLHYTLKEAAKDGHCALEEHTLLTEASKLLKINKDNIVDVLDDAYKSGDFIEEEGFVYRKAVYNQEEYLAKKLVSILDAKSPLEKFKDVDFSDPQELLKSIKLLQAQELGLCQKEAVKIALNNKISIITGGAGTGKTTTVKTIVDIFEYFSLKIELVAPTGRAAVRLSEATGLRASTIHRLLGFNRETGGFLYDKNNLLDVEVVFIDESSMIDLGLGYCLLQAIPNTAMVIFIGDIDQLPSVGAGAVLKDMLESYVIPTARLVEIFRQAAESKIIQNAHKINKGQVPINEDGTDFLIVDSANEEEIITTIKILAGSIIPKEKGFNSKTELQVLSPKRSGTLGVNNLNAVLQNTLNTVTSNYIKYGNTEFRLADKVMQIKNNYKKNVFNGDIGYIVDVKKDENKLLIDFQGLEIEYEFEDLKELSLAYCCTIHKSQGSEFPVVIIPLHTQAYIMLQRNLLYTAVTRGRKLVILITAPKPLHIAVKNTKYKQRITKLKDRIFKYYTDRSNLIPDITAEKERNQVSKKEEKAELKGSKVEILSDDALLPDNTTIIDYKDLVASEKDYMLSENDYILDDELEEIPF